MEQKQIKVDNTHGLIARWNRMVRYINNMANAWDRVYLCSMAPISAEVVRDYEVADQNHRAW